MKGELSKRTLALLTCAFMFAQLFIASGFMMLAGAVSAGTFEEQFGYKSFDEMTAAGLWALETVEKTDATAPTLKDGAMHMSDGQSVQFNWTKVNGVGSFSANTAYVFEFDATVTDEGDGSTWNSGAHTRVLYVASGGYYNHIELNNSDSKVRAGDTYVAYSSSSYKNKTVHIKLVWEGTTITASITDSNGNCLVEGYRTNSSFTDMTSRNAAMTYMVLRCEDGAVDIDNFKFSTRAASVVSDTALNLGTNQQALYSCELNYSEGESATLKLGGANIFTIADNTIKVCGATVTGTYDAGKYGVKVAVNPAQKFLCVDITLPDGGTLRRGHYNLLGGTNLVWTANNMNAVSNVSVSYSDVTLNSYEFVVDEPTASGMGANVYNIVTSFDDACTTRLLSWTAKASYVGTNAMSVKYRIKGESGWSQVDAVKVTENTTVSDEDYFDADIIGLTAETEYEYKIGLKNGADNLWTDVFTFKTAPENIEDFKFIAIGDTQSLSWGGLSTSNKGYVYAKAAIDEAIQEAGNPAFLLNAGDITESGQNLNMWNWYFKALGANGASLPHFATVGNHDTWTNDQNNYFGMHFNHPDNGKDALDLSIANQATDDYIKVQVNNPEDTIYSYNYGDAHFIVLNSGSYRSDDYYILEAQREWLIKDLQENADAKWKIILVHESAYHRIGGYESRGWLSNVIEGYGVDLVIQGHSHLVTRTYPMKDGKIVTKLNPDEIMQGTGTVYTTIGSTTLNHDSLGDPNVEECMLVLTPENYQAAYTVVSVEQDKLVMTIKQLDGQVLDSFTIKADSDRKTNVALGKPYTTSTIYSADGVNPSYPDEKGVTLTDGINAPAASKYDDPAFVGFNMNDCKETGFASVTVDLGKSYNMDEFIAKVGSQKNGAGIIAPSSVSVYVSDDNQNWTEVGTVAPTDSEEIGTVDAVIKLDKAVSGRYLQYRFVSTKNWIMVSEVEAYKSEPTSQPEQPDVPYEPTVSPTNNEENVAYGREYTHSELFVVEGSVAYPDEDGKSLTDGYIAPNDAKYDDIAFVGFNKQSADYKANGYSYITVDLGEEYYMDKFVAYVASAYNILAGISAPAKMTVCVSNDNANWTEVGSATPTDSEEIGCVDITLTLTKAVSGRYVQYRFEGNSNWMMIAEVEAFKTDAPPVEILLGDVNRDTKVDSVDYLLVKRACFGTYKLDEEQIELADIDQNKIIDSVDYLLVKRIAFGTYKA